MPESVPQVTLTKALTNGASTPPPNVAPPMTLSTDKTGDGVGNDGADSFPFAPIQSAKLAAPPFLAQLYPGTCPMRQRLTISSTLC